MYSTALSSNLAGLFSPADGSAFLLCSFSEELLALLADFSPESLLDEDEVESPSPFSLEGPLDSSLLKEGFWEKRRINGGFLSASSHFYKRSCQSVCLSVCLSVT